jgi:CrcB protein
VWRRQTERVKIVLAVLAGGAVGTGLRLAIDLLLPPGRADLPIGTFLVNLVGSFALGVLVARVWPVAPEWLRVALGPGLLGSFTTFSALAVSAVALTASGAGVTAVVYVAASLVGGIAAAALGIRLGAPAASAPPPIGADE